VEDGAGTLGELAELTRSHFDQECQRYEGCTVLHLAVAQGMYFHNGSGDMLLRRTIPPWVHPGGIRFVKKSDLIDLTSPDGQAPTQLDIDPYKSRAPVVDKRGMPIYDSATEKPWWIERPAPSERICMSTAYLVPDRELLVAEVSYDTADGYYTEYQTFLAQR